MANEVKSKVNISEDVIGMIAGVAATSIDGVKSVSGGFTKNKMSFMNGKNIKDGIEIEGNGKGLKVSLSLVLKSSANLQSTCMKVQEKVKESLEGMMDVVVKDVIVRVDNIVEDKNEK